MSDPLQVNIHNRFQPSSGHRLRINDTDVIPPNHQKSYSLDENQIICIKVHPSGDNLGDCYITLPKSADLGFISKGNANITLSYEEQEKSHFFKVAKEQPLNWELKISKREGVSTGGWPEENVSIGDDPPGISA